MAERSAARSARSAQIVCCWICALRERKKWHCHRAKRVCAKRVVENLYCLYPDLQVSMNPEQSNQVRVGVIGLGFMGATHVAAYQTAAEAGYPCNLVAVCDPKP